MADKPKENEGLLDPVETTNRLGEEISEILFNELNFFTIPTQSNVYGLTSIVSGNCTKLLLATLRGKIYSLSFNQQSMQSTLKAVGFSYIPALAEIMSIDMFVTEDHGPIVGVTLIIKKDQDSSKEIFFNIYGLHTKPTTYPDWEKIAEDWQTQNLSYTPFLLTHTQLSGADGCGLETVFLVSGDDCVVHVYRQISDEVGFCEELSSETFFPEFKDLHSSITCIDILNNTGLTRLTAFGCQNGYIRCSQVELTTNCVLWNCDTSSLDGPITTVRLFSSHTHREVKDGIETFHLLVTSAVEVGCVFMDILSLELKESPLVLPSSELYDSVLCSEVADIDWDGHNELILGTYGKKMLVYNIRHKESGQYNACLKYVREFAHPLHKILYSDVTGDGVCELVVLSTAGLHLLQHDLYQALQVVEKRLQ